jgi:hypothetical protein
MGANFEIKVDGIVRTHRDERDTAIEAARSLQQRNPGAKVAITDLRDGAQVSFHRQARVRRAPSIRSGSACATGAASRRCRSE